MSKPYVPPDIRRTAAGTIGAKVHTLKQERGTDRFGLPDKAHPMWKHYDLQNTCNISDFNVCQDNYNCKINDQLIVGVSDPSDPADPGRIVANQAKAKQLLRSGVRKERASDPYWANSDGWLDPVSSEDKDVCDWDGVSCDTLFDPQSKRKTRYISGVDRSKAYFDQSKISPPCKTTTATAITQNKWVSGQERDCNTLHIERACSDNQFCTWKDRSKVCLKVGPDGEPTSEDTSLLSEIKCKAKDNRVWMVPEQKIPSDYQHFYETTDSKVNVGKCSLDPKYHLVSGLNKFDQFRTGTLDSVLGDINNGRVSNANLISNVIHDKRGEVLMQQDNQETAVKGIIEETALSTIFFSTVNTDIIQQTLRYKVYEKINRTVHQQSPEALYIVMRSVLLQHGNFRTTSDKLAYEIRKLNFLVVKYCVDEVSSNVLQYDGYVKDLERLPTPMDRPGYNDHSSRNRTYDLSGVTVGNWGLRVGGT